MQKKCKECKEGGFIKPLDNFFIWLCGLPSYLYCARRRALEMALQPRCILNGAPKVIPTGIQSKFLRGKSRLFPGGHCRRPHPLVACHCTAPSSLSPWQRRGVNGATSQLRTPATGPIEERERKRERERERERERKEEREIERQKERERER